ncbi:MAG: hypothetical protein LBD33_03105 [Puniceicoccales bacterium]|jgi:hypothetical protein|nr:hypothetical protein [Puniceicoccales bacterium]
MDSLLVGKYHCCCGNDTCTFPKPDFGGVDPAAERECPVDRITILARLNDGRIREVSFVELIQKCTANEVSRMLDEQGVKEVMERVRVDARPKLGLDIGDKEWKQVCSLAPKMCGGRGVDMGMLLKIFVTKPDVAGKLLEGRYRRIS